MQETTRTITNHAPMWFMRSLVSWRLVSASPLVLNASSPCRSVLASVRNKPDCWNSMESSWYALPVEVNCSIGLLQWDFSSLCIWSICFYATYLCLWLGTLPVEKSSPSDEKLSPKKLYKTARKSTVRNLRQKSAKPVAASPDASSTVSSHADVCPVENVLC